VSVWVHVYFVTDGWDEWDGTLGRALLRKSRKH
jgi:hypothetical protein